MPRFSWTQALTANQKDFQPLANWQYRYAPYRAYVRTLQRTTGAAGNVTASTTLGSQVVVQRSPMQVGGTAGVTPAPLNTPPDDFIVEPGDLITISIDENVGATPTVDGIIFIDPV